MHATRWYCSSCSAPVRAWMLGNCAETVLNIILLFKVLKYGYLFSLKSSFFFIWMMNDFLLVTHELAFFLNAWMMHFSHSDALCTQTNASLQKHSQTGWNHKSTSSAWGKNMPILPLHDDNCGFVYFFVRKLGDFLWWLTGLGWSVNIYLEFFKKVKEFIKNTRFKK